MNKISIKGRKTDHTNPSSGDINAILISFY